MKCLIHYGDKRILWKQRTMLTEVFPFIGALGRKGVAEMYTLNPDNWHESYNKEKDHWGNTIIKPSQFASILETRLKDAKEISDANLMSVDPSSYSRFFIETKDQEWNGDQYRHFNYWATLPYYSLHSVEEQLDELCSSQSAAQEFFREMAIKPKGKLVL